MTHSLKARHLAIALALVLALGPAAGAEGVFDWLLGRPTATPAATEAAVTVTLPPADVLKPPTPASTPTATPAATLAPIEASGIEDDGLLRVDLRSLDAPAALHLTLAGVYAVEGDPGFRFDRDTQLALTAVDGSVLLAVGGLNLDMGPTLTLTRHRAEEGAENGIYIEESEKPTLYCGDLTVSVQGDALRAVLRIPVEEYLYGVVAYEMSDAFPIEALKAQAVAARTYAMQRKWQAGRKDYDVVDTTADQVFKGYDPEYGNVVRAVDETRGVVGLYDGGFAICYYTASNGGQTALPSQVWGTDNGDAYLAMTDDPYDVENPRSLQNELEITPDCGGSAALKAMLEAALGARLAEEGFGEGEWAFDSIASIEPVDPRFEGSRMCDGLRFGLRARLLLPTQTEAPTAAPTLEPTRDAGDEAGGTEAPTAEPTPAPTPVPREWRLSETVYEVTLDVYGQVKTELALGLNRVDCELISVETELDGNGAPRVFRLVMRRFGHGVGMSQRGAQWMAGHYDMNWREILAFYYPGLTLARMDWPGDGLTDLGPMAGGVGAARPRPTPTPSPAPLPPLKEGERYAVVTATTLNVRARPTTASQAVDQLPRGRRLIVCSEPDAEGWVSIRTGELEGYVKAEYLEYAE